MDQRNGPNNEYYFRGLEHEPAPESLSGMTDDACGLQWVGVTRHEPWSRAVGRVENQVAAIDGEVLLGPGSNGRGVDTNDKFLARVEFINSMASDSDKEGDAAVGPVLK